MDVIIRLRYIYANEYQLIMKLDKDILDKYFDKNNEFYKSCINGRYFDTNLSFFGWLYLIYHMGGTYISSTCNKELEDEANKLKDNKKDIENVQKLTSLYPDFTNYLAKDNKEYNYVIGIEDESRKITTESGRIVISIWDTKGDNYWCFIDKYDFDNILDQRSSFVLDHLQKKRYYSNIEVSNWEKVFKQLSDSSVSISKFHGYKAIKQTIFDISSSEHIYEKSLHGEFRKIEANFFDMRPSNYNHKAKHLIEYIQEKYDTILINMVKRFIEAESFYVSIFDSNIGYQSSSSNKIPKDKSEIDTFVKTNLIQLKEIIDTLGTSHIKHLFSSLYESRYRKKEYLVLRSNGGSIFYTDYYNTPIFKYAYEYIKPYNNKMLIPVEYVYKDMEEEKETIDINFLSKLLTLQDIATCKKYHDKRELDFLSRMLFYSEELECDTYKKRESLTWSI